MVDKHMVEGHKLMTHVISTNYTLVNVNKGNEGKWKE